MPTYQYQALEKSGKSAKGVVLAESREKAQAQLKEKGFYLKYLKELSPGKTKRGSLRVKCLFFRELATFLKGGKNLDEALDLVWKSQTSPGLKPVIADLKERVHRGESLAQAAQNFPRTFTPFDRAMIGTGELSGNLPPLLNRLVGYLQKEEAVRSGLRSACAYPLFVAFFSLLTVLALFTFVIPTLENLYADVGGALPLITRVLIGFSHLIQTGGVWIALVLTGLFFFLRRPQTKERVKKSAESVMLKIPVVSQWIAKREGGRFCSAMGTLVGSGLSVEEALKTAALLFKFKPYQELISEVRSQVERGASLGKTLQRSNLFPPVASSLILSGEESGNLKEQLDYLGETLEEESAAQLKHWMTFLEPAMIIAVGVVIGIVVLAVILPIVQINQMIS